MPCKITSISYALPEGKITHGQMCERFGRAVMDKIARASGIFVRRVASQNQCASDLACQAAKLILNPEIKSGIDMVIFATQTPDYMLPTTACIIQDRLGLGKGVIAFDINLGCTQFVYGLSAAKAYIDSGMARRVLLLCGDTPTRLINPKDKSAAALFSDAASACIVEHSKNAGVGEFVFGSDGKNYADLICPTSGMRRRPTAEDYIEKADENNNIRSNADLYINGFKIFAFAFKIIPQAVEALLKKSGLTKDDIDLYIFHQAGEKIVVSAAQRLGLDMKKVYFKMHDVGNCGGSSIPIAMADAIISGRLKKGMKVLVCSFGVGLSWGACIVDFDGGAPHAATLEKFGDSPQKPPSQATADFA